jgi:fluoroacetyl-CoA thioesterase
MNSENVRGAIGMASLTVRPSDTSVAQALNDLTILATPTLINILEGACSAALAEHFESGETSITTEINVSTSSAVGIGAEIHANATCVEVEGGVFKFNVEVHHGSKLVASGSIHRKLVDRVSFSARVAAESITSSSAADQ